MKILFYTDPHWSQYSSIIRSRGAQYSTRLENLIASINWVEQLAWNTGCQVIVCGGDFFDSAVLNSEELSALKNIQWAPLSHLFLTGNHETNVSSLEFSTADLFNLCPNATVISKPEHYDIDGADVEFCFLPYILERDRQEISSYFPPKHGKRIIFSHNDLKNVQYGAFLSTEGFTVEDIESNCDLCMNGHIHHCAYVSPKIINGGNLTGQNFTEDATKYEHCAQVIDTDNLNVAFYINPYAFNFYKLDCRKITSVEEIANMVSALKDHSVATVTVKSKFASIAKEYLAQVDKSRLVEYRVITEHDATTADVSAPVVEAVDHLKQFENYVLANIGTSDIVKEELLSVMR